MKQVSPKAVTLIEVVTSGCCRVRVTSTAANASSPPSGGKMPVSNVSQGQNVRISHADLVNLYDCSLGDGTQVGPFVEIQRDVTIGARCKISSHSFVCSGVTIEDEVMIAHGVMFTNDLFPRATNDAGELQSGEDWELVPTLVKRRAAVGANATIVAGIVIGEGALVGAGAVVTRDVPDYAIVAGVPARVVGDTRARSRGRYLTGHVRSKDPA
jgi:acetyltransferase-like isoleucine patch superfamily enzyme